MATLAQSAGKTLVTRETAIDLTKKENHLVVQETFSLVSGGNKNYNIATLLGAEASKYDLATIEPEVFVTDTEAGSPTQGYYVRADSVAAMGFKTTGEVTIRNSYPTALAFLVRIRITKKSTS